MIGHKYAQAYLHKTLPKCTLLLGPDSVGKRTLSHQVLCWHNIADVDFLEMEKINIASVREVGPWSMTLPRASAIRLLALDLDGCSTLAHRALLKVLEEAPGPFRAILRATPSAPVPDTIRSRAHVLRMGYLREDEIFEILVGKGMSIPEARKCAGNAQGQVKNALDVKFMDSRDRLTALSLIESFMKNDKMLFKSALVDIDDSVLALMRVWSLEACTGRWCEFSEKDIIGSTRDIRRIMIELQKDIRPKLLLKQMCENIMR